MIKKNYVDGLVFLSIQIFMTRNAVGIGRMMNKTFLNDEKVPASMDTGHVSPILKCEISVPPAGLQAQAKARILKFHKEALLQPSWMNKGQRFLLCHPPLIQLP